MKNILILFCILFLFSSCLSQIDIEKEIEAETETSVEVKEDSSEDLQYFTYVSMPVDTNSQTVVFDLEEIILPDVNHELLPIDPFLRLIELKKRYYSFDSIEISPFPSNTVTSMASKGNSLYCGTLRGGVFLYSSLDKKWKVVIKPIESLYNRAISDIIFDESENEIYIGSFNGLYHFDNKKDTFETINESMEDRSVLSLAILKGVVFWSSARGNLFYLTKENKPVKIYKFNANIVKIFMENDKIYLFNSKGEVYRGNDEFSFELLYSLGDSLKMKITINDILISDETFYFLSNRGLFTWSPEKEAASSLCNEIILLKGWMGERYIYAGTHSSGVLIYDKMSGTHEDWGLDQGIPSLNIPSVAFLNNNIILSIPEKGILYINEEIHKKL